MVLRDRELERELDPMRIRPAAVLGVALVLCAVGWLAWQAFDEPVDAGRVSALQQAVRLPAVWTPTEPPAPDAAIAPLPPAAAAASASAVVPPGHMEVCGLGVVSQKPDPVASRAFEARLVAARARTAAALQARGDDTPRAVGLLLATLGQDTPTEGATPCVGAACAEAAARAGPPAVLVRRVEATGPQRDQLVRLALGTRSPAAYEAALRACHHAAALAPTATGACGQLSPEQWARLDPSNAHAWLAVAEAAMGRRDPNAVAEALHRVAHAPPAGPSWGRFTRQLLDALPADVAPLEGWVLMNDMAGLEMTTAPRADVAARACSAAALRDTNRAQLCDAVARRLLAGDGDLGHLAVGAGIGRRLGWSPDRLADLDEERQALLRVSAQQVLPAAVSVGCEGIRMHGQYLRTVGEVGERRALRRLVAASDRSLAEWAAMAPATAASGLVAAPESVASGPAAAWLPGASSPADALTR